MSETHFLQGDEFSGKKDEHQNQSGHDFEDIYGHFYSGSSQIVTTRGQ